MPIARHFLAAASLTLMLLLSACGGDDTPAPGKTLGFEGDRVAFTMGFFTFNGNLLASSKIYMRVFDDQGRTVFGTDVLTNEEGVGRFENVPAGDFGVEFVYGPHQRCTPDINLASFKGERSGALAGDCSF